MPGPVGKHPTVRRKAGAGRSTVTNLVVAESSEVPPLRPSEHAWHPQTLAWWSDVWSSPMAAEFDTSDVHGLYMLAVLVDAFWTEPTKELASEIRLQRQCFGLTPIDRRRLQWEIGRGDAATASTEQRRRPRAVSSHLAEDPRKMLGG